MSTPPDYRITCSCGRQCLIHWHPSDHQYFTLSPNWRPSYPAGWTCGRESHTQRVPPIAESPAEKSSTEKHQISFTLHI